MASQGSAPTLQTAFPGRPLFGNKAARAGAHVTSPLHLLFPGVAPQAAARKRPTQRCDAVSSTVTPPKSSLAWPQDATCASPQANEALMRATCALQPANLGSTFAERLRHIEDGFDALPGSRCCSSAPAPANLRAHCTAGPQAPVLVANNSVSHSLAESACYASSAKLETTRQLASCQWQRLLFPNMVHASNARTTQGASVWSWRQQPSLRQHAATESACGPDGTPDGSDTGAIAAAVVRCCCFARAAKCGHNACIVGKSCNGQTSRHKQWHLQALHDFD